MMEMIYINSKRSFIFISSGTWHNFTSYFIVQSPAKFILNKTRTGRKMNSEIGYGIMGAP
jgi:hypothetical protein